MLRRVIFLLLLLSAACNPSSAEEIYDDLPRCIHDDIRKRIKGSNQRSFVAISAPSPRVADPQFDLSPKPTPTYHPIRIATFYTDVTNCSRYCSQVGQLRPDFQGNMVTCTTGNILTLDKMGFIRKNLVRGAVKLHEERLMVVPNAGRMVIPKMTDEVCREFTIPPSHSEEGVDADFVLYVSSGVDTDNVMAWAATCLYHPDGRPAVGVMNIGAKHVFSSNFDRVVAHELLHALGFDGDMFESRRMVRMMPKLRGKKDVPIVNSPSVVARAGNQFDCDALPGMELEDAPGSGTYGSHWKRRNAKDDLMASTYSGARYTAITIAAMEDTGFYKGNYTMAEDMAWGKNAGCQLMRERCVQNGTSQFPGMFCTQSPLVSACPTDRNTISYCNMVEGSEPLPAQFRYFSDPKLGGASPMDDYCPVVESSTINSCITGNTTFMPGSRTSPTAKCFDSTNLEVANSPEIITALCVDVQCHNTTQSYKVRFLGADDWIDCTPGEKIKPSQYSDEFYGGTVKCPPYAEVCPDAYFDSLMTEVIQDPWIDAV